MAQLNYTNIPATSIATPASGVCSMYVDSIDKKRRTKDDAGFVDSYTQNFSIAAQSITAVTRTYITGTNFKVCSNKLQAGSMFRWVISMTKTAAGIATSTFDVAFGTAGTTADTARLSFTKPAGTAIADEGKVTIECIIRSIGASGVAVGEFSMIHNLAATGHMLIPCAVVNTISAGFDTTVAGMNIGVCITSGSADVITIQLVQAEAWDI
jgi:hypothetical protein